MAYFVLRTAVSRGFAVLLAILVTGIVIAQLRTSASSGLDASTSAAQVGRPHDAVAVRAAKRGNPRMNLQDPSRGSGQLQECGDARSV